MKGNRVVHRLELIHEATVRPSGESVSCSHYVKSNSGDIAPVHGSLRPEVLAIYLANLWKLRDITHDLVVI